MSTNLDRKQKQLTSKMGGASVGSPAGRDVVFSEYLFRFRVRVCMGRRESCWVFPISLFCDVEACGASTDVVSCVVFSSLRFLLHLVVNHARCPADELCRVPTIARVCRLDYTGSRVYSPLLFICWPPPVNSVPPVIHE